MLTVAQSMALRYHNNDISLNEYTLIYKANASAGLIQEGMIGSAKNAVVDIVQVAAGAGAIAGTGGAGGDTITDSLIAIETQTSTLNTIMGLADDALLFKELYDSARQISLDNGLGAIYTATENIMFGLADRFDNIKEFLDEQRDKLLEFIDTLLRSADKWVSAMLPDDAGLGGIVLRETVSWAIRKLVENPYTMVRKAVETKLPEHLQNMLFDEEYAIRWFQEDIIDATADFLDERASRQGKDELDPWARFLKGSESESFPGKMYDWYRNVANLSAHRGQTMTSIAADVFGTHPEDLQIKLDSGEITEKEFSEKMEAFKTSQETSGKADEYNPMNFGGRLHGAALDKLEQALPGYLRETIRPAVPAAVKTARFIIALLFAALAALQITIRGDYKEDDVKEEDLTPKQRAYVAEVEKDIKKKGGHGHPLMRNILLNTMGKKDPTSRGYAIPSPEELQDKYPALDAAESTHILDSIKKSIASLESKEASNLAGVRKLAAGNMSRERTLRLNIRKMILESEGYTIA